MWVRAFRDAGKLSPPDAVSLSSSSVVLAPGERVGAHVTAGKEELLLVLEGVATLYAGGATALVTAGRAAYVPPETLHDVANEGDVPLRYVYVTARVGKP